MHDVACEFASAVTMVIVAMGANVLEYDWNVYCVKTNQKRDLQITEIFALFQYTSLFPNLSTSYGKQHPVHSLKDFGKAELQADANNTTVNLTLLSAHLQPQRESNILITSSFHWKVKCCECE